jgi:hypothetical protein
MRLYGNLFCDYILFYSDESWKSFIQWLRPDCRGEIVGTDVEVEVVKS